MICKNSEIQALFQKALDKLDEIDGNKKRYEKLYAASWIERIKEYSNSGNEIPGLRGLGLEKTIKLAEEILENGLDNVAINWSHSDLFSYKSSLGGNHHKEL